MQNCEREIICERNLELCGWWIRNAMRYLFDVGLM